MPINSVVKFTDRLDMTIVVDWDVKPKKKILTTLFKVVTSREQLTLALLKQNV